MPIRHALRSLKRTPGFTLAVILTLVLGIAAIGSMFAVVYGVLLAPLPYGEPDRLVSVRLQSIEQDGIGIPPAAYFTYQEHARSVDELGLYRTGSTNLWIEGVDQAAESVVATWITASMVPLLQVPPLLGRTFTADEERRGGPDAVILSEAEWRTRFGAAPDVIGKTLTVNSVRRQVVGVMPARFSFPTAHTRVWLPVKHTGNATVGEFLYAGVARLAAGVTASQAQRDLAAILPRMAEAFPNLESGGSTATWLTDARPTPAVINLRDFLTADIARTLWMLAAAAALVLLVAWANVANLMLIRADGRQPELAVRTVLGASRLRTATHFLGEAIVLGIVSGAIALPAAYGAVRALVAFGPADVPRLAELGIGWPAIGFIALITAASVLVCAAVPAGRFWRASLSLNLREAGRGDSTGKSRLRVRAAITTLQIAIALVVSIGSALLLRTAHQLSQVHPGFESAQVLTFRSQLPFARYDEAEGIDFYARLAAQVRELPSVDSAGMAMSVPLGNRPPAEQTFQDEHGQPRTLRVNIVDNGYFQAMSIPVLAAVDSAAMDRRVALGSFDSSVDRRVALGSFDSSVDRRVVLGSFASAVDRRVALGSLDPPTQTEKLPSETRQSNGTNVILSRQAAITLFDNPDPSAAIGKQLKLAKSGRTYTVVAIVGDVRHQDLTIAPAPLVYRPHVATTDPAIEPEAPRNMALVIKSKGPPSDVIAGIRQVMRTLDPSVPIYNLETMSDVVRASTARLSLVLTLMTVAAAITLLLGTIGLYGVMSYMVALRTREFGVRVALGADPRRIARLVATHGLLLTTTGIAAGFACYALAAPFLRAYLYGVTATDQSTLAATTLLLIVTAAFATWLPARRAARVDPAEALRAD